MTATQTTQTAVAVEATKIDRVDFYAYFTATDTFKELVNAIPDPDIKAAIEQWGIGDDLTRSDLGKWIYDYESGGLLSKPVQEALENLEDDNPYLLATLDEENEEWDNNYHAICEIAEAYAAFANANALQT